MNRLIKYCPTHSDNDLQSLEEVLNECTREEALGFLQWNDPNGIYTDERSAGEDMTPMTECEAKVRVMRVFAENRPMTQPLKPRAYMVMTLNNNGTPSVYVYRADEEDALKKATLQHQMYVQAGKVYSSNLAVIIESTDY